MTKLLFCYLCDACDIAGVWEVNRRTAEFELGAPIDWDAALRRLGDRIEVIAGGRKWRIVKFIQFQYPKGLHPECRPHRAVLNLLARHGIDAGPGGAVEPCSIQGHGKGSDGLGYGTRQGQGQGQGLSGGCRGDLDPEDITTPRPGDPPYRSEILTRTPTWPEWHSTHAKIRVDSADRDTWAAALRLWGAEALGAAYDACLADAEAYAVNNGRPKDRARVYLDRVMAWLPTRFALTADDYRRAGMPVPANLRDDHAQTA